MTRHEGHRRTLQLQFSEEKHAQNAVSEPEKPTARRCTGGTSGLLTHKLFTAVRVMIIPDTWEGSKEVSSQLIAY